MYAYAQYYPSIPNYYGFYSPYPLYRTYPPVDTKVFSSSVKHFRLLMEQGSILLNKLAETSFETKIMNAAQQGKQAEVDKLIKSIGLKVPVATHYTPSGVKFILALPAAPGSFGSCCNLTVSIKWGN